MLASYAAQQAEWEARQRELGLLKEPEQEQEEQDLITLAKKMYEELYKEYARYDSFWIAIQDNKNGNWQKPKLFKRHKITVKDFAKAEVLKDEINSDYGYVEPSSEQLQEEEDKEIDTVKDLEHVLNYYRFMAQCYLKMSAEEFDYCDCGKVRLIVDACNYRTVHTFVEGSKSLYEFTHLLDAEGKPMTAHLTDKDREMLELYTLWRGPAKIKPWIRNGGMMYEEDINVFLRLDSLYHAGEAYKNKKAKARESLQSGQSAVMGQDGVLHKHKTTFRNR